MSQDFGTFAWTTAPQDGYELRILHADPRVLLPNELLDDVRRGGLSSPATLDGDILRIAAVNRTVVYRLGDRTARGTVAEWPD
jgi:hypothetical protein